MIDLRVYDDPGSEPEEYEVLEVPNVSAIKITRYAALATANIRNFMNGLGIGNAQWGNVQDSPAIKELAGIGGREIYRVTIERAYK